MEPTLTREQILAMPAGRELDALVAVLTFGEPERCLHSKVETIRGSLMECVSCKEHFGVTTLALARFWPEPFSASIEHAWQVVEKMGRGEQKSWFEISIRPTAWCVNMTGDPKDNVHAETAPHAIVLAALLTKLKAEVKA